ncbi:DUF4371 domain-containing protein [Trichonephila clavipes]|nr:DUF4371 domain-containing protein [Trichonephila clavipes]
MLVRLLRTPVLSGGLRRKTQLFSGTLYMAASSKTPPHHSKGPQKFKTPLQVPVFSGSSLLCRHTSCEKPSDSISFHSVLVYHRTSSQAKLKIIYGNYIKDCLIAAVEEICSEKLNIFTQISLSRQTVERRIENISSDICASLNTITTSIVYFSLALDKTSDINGTAQLAVFIRGADSQMNITEKLIELLSLKGTTTGRDTRY